MSDSAPLIIAVVGCGWIMRSIYAPVLLSLGHNVRVCAVCDLDADSVRAMAGRFANSAAFTEVAAMLKGAKPDAVLVLTSERATAGVAREVLKAGLPVYIEKPPAASSTELEELIAAEAHGETFAYTAFNRRHVPLFHSLVFSGRRVQRISGVLKRMKRAVASFPATAIHLIDSAQYYSQAHFRSWEVSFAREAECSVWTVKGELENGAACDLELIPDGGTFAEALVLETGTETWELRLPNSHAEVPEGERILRRQDGSPAEVTRGPKDCDSLEAMGFRSCLLDFIGHAQARKAPLLHRLTSCRATIRIVEEMELRIPSPPGPNVLPQPGTPAKL